LGFASFTTTISQRNDENARRAVFRRLCREAVIFMLLGMVLFDVSGAIWIYKAEPTNPDWWFAGLSCAAIGFIIGFGVWLFHRLVRFAIKG
jgi:hypothetical protein